MNMQRQARSGRPTRAESQRKTSIARQRASGSVARRKTIPEYLEKEEVEAIIKAAHSERARFLILMMWRAGLRVSEAIDVHPADFSDHSERPTLKVRHGKGNKERLVPVHPELRIAMGQLADWVKPGQPFVPMHRSTADIYIKKARQRAIDTGTLQAGKVVRTHTFRHSAARHWLASAVPINVVSRWLGHSSLQTTLVYLEIMPDPLGDIQRVP